MNKETLTALKESIAKWEKRASGDHSESVGLSTCPLCHLFNNDESDDACLGCPVFEKTNLRSCNETPFQEYANKHTNKNAQKEVDFLKSLLPPSEEEFNWSDLDYLEKKEKPLW